MWKELRGEPCIGFKEMPAAKKQIATTRTFDHDIADYEPIHQRIAQYSASCAEKLRVQNSVCGEMVVFILTNRHKENVPQYYENCIVKLSVPTDSTLELTKCAVDMLRKIFLKGYAYKRAGGHSFGLSFKNRHAVRYVRRNGPRQARPTDENC